MKNEWDIDAAIATYNVDAWGGGYFTVNGTLVRSQVAPGGGFLPSPQAGIVEIGGSKYPFVLDNPFSGPPIQPTYNVYGRRFRTYWRESLE